MKKIMKWVFAIGTIMAFAFASGVTAQEWTKEQLEIWQVVEDGWDKWSKNDVEGSLASVHEQYQGWNQDDPLPTDKIAVKKWYDMMKDVMAVELYDLKPARISVTDNAAVVDYYFEFYAVYTWGEKKTEKEIKGKNAEFYVKEKGKWMLLGDMTVFDEEEDDD